MPKSLESKIADEGRFKRIVGLSPNAIIAIDRPTLSILDMNPEAQNLFPKFGIGKKVLDLLDGNKTYWERVLKKITASSSGKYERYLEIEGKDYKVTLIHDEPNGELFAFFGEVAKLGQKAKLADIDGLTGLYNRRYFDGACIRMIGRAYTTHRPLSMILLDIDHFKNINDSHGHLEGDRILKEIAKLMQVRAAEGIPARMGGEEFGIILKEDKEEAYQVGERVRDKVQSQVYIGEIRVTISGGVAGLPINRSPPLSYAELYKMTDDALYRSKNSGRNQITVWTENIGELRRNNNSGK